MTELQRNQFIGKIKIEYGISLAETDDLLPYYFFSYELLQRISEHQVSHEKQTKELLDKIASTHENKIFLEAFIEKVIQKQDEKFNELKAHISNMSINIKKKYDFSSVDAAVYYSKAIYRSRVVVAIIIALAIIVSAIIIKIKV